MAHIRACITATNGGNHCTTRSRVVVIEQREDHEHVMEKTLTARIGLLVRLVLWF
jgi:hypothetical protein